MNHILADFSKHVDYPLVNSKFAVYICTYVDADRTICDMPLLIRRTARIHETS